MDSSKVTLALRALGYDSHRIRLYLGQEEAAGLEDLCWLFSVSDQNRQNDLLPQIQSHGTSRDYAEVINRCPEGSSVTTWALDALGAAALTFGECARLVEETRSKACAELLTHRMAAMAAAHDEWHAVWHLATKYELLEIQQKAIAGMADTAEQEDDVLCTWDHAGEGSPERAAMEAKLDGMDLDCDHWIRLGASLHISSGRSRGGGILGLLMPEFSIVSPEHLPKNQVQLGKMAAGRAASSVENFFQAMAAAGMAKAFDEDCSVQQALDRAAELAEEPGQFIEVIEASKDGSPRHVAMMAKLAAYEAPLDVWAAAYNEHGGYVGDPHRLLIMRKALGEPVTVPQRETATV